MRRALVLLALCGCAEPPYLTVTIVDGTAERVNDLNGAQLQGSFALHVVSPPGAKPTDLLLLELDGDYRYPSPCSPRPVRLTLTSERNFPVNVAPGAEEHIPFTFGA